jgi:hypothetical protein
VSNGLEEVSDARSESSDRLLDQQNTDIRIVDATYHDQDTNVTISATNDGTTALSVTDTGFLLDNTYRTVGRSATQVEGDTGTDAWLPGEDAQPRRPPDRADPSQVTMALNSLREDGLVVDGEGATRLTPRGRVVATRTSNPSTSEGAGPDGSRTRTVDRS